MEKQYSEHSYTCKYIPPYQGNDVWLFYRGIDAHIMRANSRIRKRDEEQYHIN